MKKSILLLIFCFILILQKLTAQNLVPNGDFESYSTLPTSYAQWYKCANWSNVNGIVGLWPYGTPDYFHVSGGGGGGLPNSYFGMVSPYSGDAIMGIVTLHKGYGQVSNFREYLSVQLSSPLNVGTVYNVKFRITNGNSNHYYGYSCNNIGVLFSKFPLSQVDHEPITKSPQLEITGEVWTTSWQLASFSFTADSAYNYLTIGNFNVDTATSYTFHVNTSYNDTTAYYFIDNFEVSPFVQNTVDTTICMGDSINLWAKNDTSFAWADSLNPGLIISNDSILIVEPTTTSTYFMYGSNDTTAFTVTVNYSPTVNLGPDTFFCFSRHLFLNAATPNATYLWQDGSLDSSYIVKTTGLYWVEVNVNGCTARDSIEVEYRSVDQTVSQNSGTLTANADGAGYQWLNCEGYTSIIGANNQSFSPTASGSYAVVVSQNSCADTSECFAVVGVDNRNLADNINLYPNPTNGMLHLDLGTYHPEVEVQITNILGQVVGKNHSQNTNNIDLEIKGDAGIYFVVIKTGASLPVVIKVLKR